MLKEMYKNNGYEYVTNMLPCLCAALLVCFQLSFDFDARLVFCIVAVCVFIMTIALKNYQKVITYIAGIILIAVAAYFLIEKVNIEEYILWLQNSIKGEEIKNLMYYVVTVVLVTIIVTIPLYFLQKIFMVKVVLSGVFTAYIAYLCYLEMNIDKMCIVAMILYILLIVTEYIYARNTKDLEKTKGVMTSLLPVVLIAYCAFIFLAYPKERYQWTVVKKAYDFVSKVGSEIAELIDKDNEETPQSDYVVNFAGYSEEGDVGGSINTSGSTISLFVEFKNNDVKPIYIKGNESNYFDGKKWTSTNSKYRVSCEYELDTIEYLYAILRAGKMEEVKNYVTEEEYKITYNSLKTKAIFVPEKTLRIDIPEKLYYSLNYNEPIFLDTAKSSTTYIVKYLRLNTGKIEELVDLAEGYHYAYDQLEYYNDNKFLSSFEANHMNLSMVNLESEFANRAARIEKEYLDTTCATEKVKLMAKEITKGCKTDYEKVKAIESYLRQYTYTTEPKVCPKGKDMLEYFLFESKEGYCTYFATACAIMSRCVGVPTRYIQGFVVETDELGPSLGMSNFKYRSEVKSKQAHAWVEAYIEGVGFVTLEPTPGYIELLENNWENSTDEQPEIEQDRPTADVTIQKVEDKIQRNELDTKALMVMFFKVIATIVLLVVATLGIYVIYKVFSYRNRYKKATVQEKMYMDTSFILTMAQEMGCALKNYETINEYMSRLATYYPELTHSFKKIGSIYTKVRYDDAVIDDNDLYHFRSVREKMQQVTRETIGSRKYIMNIYCKM